ncbi:glycoside hydrolase family 15 protein [Streptomyces sp. MS1.HAVA.3]|uniref:Glycoside hydrolase family 15 protein n=1 Tax=Streptomyces caledonius TaxID=3134107 RepID=A0ABU8UFR1_9ACTN
MGRRLPLRGRAVLPLDGTGRRRRPGPPPRPPDHVRHPRRTRPERTRTARLPGWRDSRPVRTGNGAWAQRQLDVYGELLAAFHKLREHLQDADEHTRAFLTGLADTAAVRWREKDQGIWEVRSEPQHFLYSKLMCWVALDRALDLAEELGAQERTRSGAGPGTRSARPSNRKGGASGPAPTRRRSARTPSTRRP